MPIKEADIVVSVGARQSFAIHAAVLTRPLKHSHHPSLLGIYLSLLLSCPDVFSQQIQRPDAGTLQEPQRQISLLPQPGSPPISLPEVKPALPVALVAPAVRITPSAFRFEGNSVFDSATLSDLLEERLNQPTDLAGLTEAASQVSRYYRSRGYLLTDAYLPEQALQATGGTVTIAVIEARIGRVEVRLQGDGRLAAFLRRVVTSSIAPGSLVTEYLLDKPVLHLRDLAGVEASATVEPGQQIGQADVIITVQAGGRQASGSVGVDNSGASAAGALRLGNTLDLSNLVEHGDVLSGRAQVSETSQSHLYRLSYTLPVDAAGTRLALSAARSDYALAKQFSALGATGQADILGASLTRPLIRSRDSNLYGRISAEHKNFRDEIAVVSFVSWRQITSANFGFLGNWLDEKGGGGSATNYALSTTLGRAKMDAASLGFDQGLGGLRTAGRFQKLNLEFQRVQFLGSPSSLHFSLQAQLASKNLASAEKMALGGPTGVRAYPVGEGIGDSGLLLNLECRYQLPVPLAGEPVSLAAFYDYGTVRFNQEGAALAGVANRVSLGAVGIGMVAGRVNHFLLTAYLAWGTSSTSPSTGDPDRSPRVWLSAQKWF